MFIGEPLIDPHAHRIGAQVYQGPVSRHLGKLDQRRLPLAGQRLASREQLFDVAGRGTRPGEVETLRRRQLQKSQQVPSLVGNPVVQRVVRRPVAQDVRRRTVAGEL